MIEIKKLKMMPNWVLVKINADHETYQINGNDTMFYSAQSAGTAGQRMNVTGTVVLVPLSLRYNGHKLKVVRNQMYSGELSWQADGLRFTSVAYNVPMELKEEDEVVYLYKNQLDAYKHNLDIEIDGITYMRMRYDNIRAIIRGEDELYPLNGGIFLEPLELKGSKIFTEIEKKHMGMKIKRGGAFGRVLEVGCFVDGYLDFPDKPADDRTELKKGDLIYYDARMANHLQYDMQQTFKTKRILVHRKDIHAVLPDESMFDFAE